MKFQKQIWITEFTSENFFSNHKKLLENFGEDDNGNLTLKKIDNDLVEIYELKNENQKHSRALIYEEI